MLRIVKMLVFIHFLYLWLKANRSTQRAFESISLHFIHKKLSMCVYGASI